MGGEPYDPDRMPELLAGAYYGPLDVLGAMQGPICAWCAGTFGQPTREMELGLPSPPQYLCPEHQAKWDDIVAVRVPLLRKELFHIPAGQGAMRGIPRTLSVSGTAAVALGLTEDPLFKVARDEVEREKQQDDLDRQRWEILRDAANAALEPGRQAARMVEEHRPIQEAISELVRRQFVAELERDVDRVYGNGDTEWVGDSASPQSPDIPGQTDVTHE
jgi:hypothetical protein